MKLHLRATGSRLEEVERETGLTKDDLLDAGILAEHQDDGLVFVFRSIELMQKDIRAHLQAATRKVLRDADVRDREANLATTDRSRSYRRPS